MNEKKALIIGATSDIAHHIAIGLAKRDYGLILTGRNQSKLDSLKNEILSIKKIEIKTHLFDITEFPSHQNFYESLPNKPDLVICCVGYYEDQKIARINQGELLNTINVNYAGVLSIINIISNDFELNKSGQIVVLSSVAGDRGRQLNYIYGSTKAGLTNYLSGLRNRLHTSNVVITTILLGPVYTKMSDGHKLIPWLTLNPDIAAEKIIKATLQKKDTVYIFWPWSLIMFLIRMIPEFIFKRLPPF